MPALAIRLHPGTQHRLIHPLERKVEADVHAIEAAMGGWAELWSRLGTAIIARPEAATRRPHRARSIFLGSDRLCQLRRYDLAALVPGCGAKSESGGLWTPRAGVLLADIVADMVQLIDGLGCRLLPHRPVLETRNPRRALPPRSRRTLPSDLVIVAAGAGTSEVVRELASPARRCRPDDALFSRTPGLGSVRPSLIDFGPATPCGSRRQCRHDAKARRHRSCRIEWPLYAAIGRIAETFAPTNGGSTQARCRYCCRTADGMRILEPVKGTDQRVWVVAGCNGGGFKLAPLVADTVLHHVPPGGDPRMTSAGPDWA